MPKTLMMMIAALALSIWFSCSAFARADDLWWVDVQFTPSEQTIESIPIRSLDRSWAAASTLRESGLPKEASVPGDRMEDNAASFEIEGDFNHDGKADKLLVGVYRTTSGKTGEFLLILTRNSKGQWSKAKLFKADGKPGFSALMRVRGQLSWVFCFECDSFCDLRPSSGSWKLDCDALQPDDPL